MGIRFQCHLCGAELNVKDHQAGKRGRCPTCHGSFRIPVSNAQFSLAPDDRPAAALEELTSGRPVADNRAGSNPKRWNHPAEPPATSEAVNRSKSKFSEVAEPVVDKAFAQPAAMSSQPAPPLSPPVHPEKNPPTGPNVPTIQVPSPRQRNRETRRQRRRRHHRLILIVLSLVFLALLSGLILVLWLQSKDIL